MNNLQHLVALLSKRGIEFTSEEDEFIDAIEEDLKEKESLESEVEDLEQEVIDVEKERDKKDSEIYELEKKLDRQTIRLSGGIIRADIDSLDYMTRESFKSWCQQHAITNSEPVFNL